MKLTWELCDKMYDFIQNMQFDKWYPVKSDLAYEAIIQLFDEGIICNCELNSRSTYIQKNDLSGYGFITFKKNLE